MSTRGELRGFIRTNLADAGLGTYYDDNDINESIQDAYNEIVTKTLCNVKSSLALAWSLATSPYLDFLNDFGVIDYLGTLAIFNNNSNFWLRDDVSLRDLDKIRRDWELWKGQPQFWCPHSQNYVVVLPVLQSGTGTFDLWYYGVAPILANDNETPIIAADMHTLIEWYSSADLLESAEEPGKASFYWGMYESAKAEYKERCHNLAQAQLLLRI